MERPSLHQTLVCMLSYGCTIVHTCVLAEYSSVGQVVMLATPQVVVAHLWGLVSVYRLGKHDTSALDKSVETNNMSLL